MTEKDIKKDKANQKDNDKIDEDMIQNNKKNLNEKNKTENHVDTESEDKTKNVESEKEKNLKNSKEDELKLEIEQLRDEKLRLLAEMENLRKRADKEKIDSIRYGSFHLARDILMPDDNLSRALEIISKEENISESVKNLIDGLNMVQKEFSTILEKHGVKKINALNEKFDHNFHQAMVEIENNEVDEGTVVEEMQSGYIMHDRLLRPSMVGVSKKSDKEGKKG
tara:strand:- start:379 stop:1050 length:672 start_codon:yes stop_codon:yes gene_type:complete